VFSQFYIYIKAKTILDSRNIYICWYYLPFKKEKQKGVRSQTTGLTWSKCSDYEYLLLPWKVYIQVLCHLLPSVCVRYWVQSKGRNAFSCCLQSQFFSFCFYWEVGNRPQFDRNTKWTYVSAFEGGQKCWFFLLIAFRIKKKCSRNDSYSWLFMLEFYVVD